MTDDEYWHEDKAQNGWVMPTAPWWKRLWGIRHVRAAILRWKVERHNRFYRSIGKIPTGYDSWVLYGTARGWERSND